MPLSTMIIIFRGGGEGVADGSFFTTPFCSNLNNDWIFECGMSIVLTDSLKKLLIETAFQLKGSAKRKFMAQTVQGLGLGGQRLASSELGWNRDTIRKGTRELKSGITFVDNMSTKGRYKAEEHLPNLLEDIKNLVDFNSQADRVLKAKDYIPDLVPPKSESN
ncbi:hypothetical protein [Nostoc sp.]|uniref:hypothetical protein n=1 Tax=Nostoc sp. TaxID=1180 RepID=UPI003FA5707F